MSEKMRVHILAKQLNVPSKTIIEKCRAEGIASVKNHMSTLSAGLHATICEWFSDGSHDTAVETTSRVDLKKVRLKKKARQETPDDTGTPQTVTTVADRGPEQIGGDGKIDQVAATAAEVVDVPIAPAEQPESESAEPVVEASAPVEVIPEPVAETPITEEPETPAAPLAEPASTVDKPTELEVESAPVVEQSPEPEPSAEVVEQPAAEVPTEAPESDEPATAEVPEVMDAESAQAEEPAADAQQDETPSSEGDETEAEAKEDTPPAPDAPKPQPAGPQNVPAPAKLQGPRVVRYEAPDRDVYTPRRRPTPRPAAEVDPGGGPPMPSDSGKAGRRKGRTAARRGGHGSERLSEYRDRDLAERRERVAGATGRRIHRRRSSQPGSKSAPTQAGPKTEATVHEPVRLKEFCSETGLNFVQLFRVLNAEHNIVANINMTLPTETAELLALHFGIDLTVVPAKTLLDELGEEFTDRQRKKLKPRPPVVAMLGHVDHGKTSLLDAIRSSRVAVGEDGGITQHISSYHIETGNGAVTFLDTPGHEAFTAMRARGAQVTDVVVLVIAADDGVMPQTMEAINHAKAAEVPVVVALNKIDLGDQNLTKIYGQLAEHDLTPSGDWGGQTDVIRTSATSGQGITELLEHLADLSAILELKADPTVPAQGTTIEAETKAGVGSVVLVLIQEGTLRVGDFVVCGNACGKVRALVNDRGERITQAGPSMPVEVWGLDDVPLSGDKLYQVKNMQRAKSIAAETKQARVTDGRVQSTKATSLEDIFKQRDAGEIPELNIIIKADVDGSVAALKQSLSQFPDDEVRLSIRHAAVGAVNDSDVLLATACKGIIVAFRVDAPVGAKRLAEQHGVEIRPYRVIYDVCDDVKKALEGLLSPEERIEPRGAVDVRQVFHISKLGLVAGSYVTDGTIQRNHFAKVLRDGVIVRDRCRLASLRRVKEDVKEVRAGLECGIRLEGFDDVKQGDVIETYEVVEVPRTL